MGLGPYNVAKRTSFNTEAEVAPALLHAAKSKILCELRSVSVCKDDVLRLRVHPESLGFASVVCRLLSLSESPAQPRNPEKDDLGTHKHRMLWLISTSKLRSISSRNHARSAGQPRNPEKDDSATGKHRMLWMISTSELRSIRSQNHARCAGFQDYRYHTPAATTSSKLLDLAYSKDTIHVLRCPAATWP